MPHLKFTNVKQKDVILMSKELLEILSTEFGCPMEHITFDFLTSQRFFKGREVNDEVIIEIKLFKREEMIKKKVSEIISNYLKNLKYQTIVIIFEEVTSENYYRISSKEISEN